VGHFQAQEGGIHLVDAGVAYAEKNGGKSKAKEGGFANMSQTK
jgi:hypothetical protein